MEAIVASGWPEKKANAHIKWLREKRGKTISETDGIFKVVS